MAQLAAEIEERALLSPAIRLLSEMGLRRFVQEDGDHWIWRGTVLGGLYPYLKIAGRREYVCRLSWELHHGQPLTRGQQVRHACDESRCVNPRHLRVVGRRNATA
jgi:hypothetical protein